MSKGYFNLVTAPTVEPLTIAELRQHLHLDVSDGEPAPIALTAAKASSTGGNLSAGIYKYRATFKTADGETDGGTISSAITVTSTSKLAKLTAIPIGGSLVTHRLVYRTTAGGSSYALLTTLSDNATSTYTDNVADTSLGVGCPTTNTTVDPELTSVLKTAREWIENACNRSIINTTYDYFLDCFPCDNCVITIPKGKLQSAVVNYIDTSGSTQTWSAAKYNVISPDRKYGFIEPAYGEVYPDTREQRNAVTIRCVIGYGSAVSAVPYKIKQAMKILCSELYEKREATGENKLEEIPYGVTSLLSFEEIDTI